VLPAPRSICTSCCIRLGWGPFFSNSSATTQATVAVACAIAQAQAFIRRVTIRFLPTFAVRRR